MTSKALVLLGLFAVLLVVSEVAAAAETQSGTVKSGETVQPNQQSYGTGGSYSTGGSYCHHGCCYLTSRGCTRCCPYG